jgi:uncharacterized protein
MKQIKNIMLFTFVFIALIVAYIAFHWFAYFSTVHFFTITDPAAKKILLAVVIFLGCSFFAATFLSHWNYNVFTKAYYLFSGVWVGLLINLALFFILAWVVLLISSLTGSAGWERALGIMVVCAAIVYSVYGIWNAFTPMVTHLDIKINNLPENWIGKKVVQISDVHLGHIYGPEYMENVVQRINALKPDIIFITGDLFDGTDGNLDIFVQPLNELSAPQGIYFITGNHETYLGVENALAIINKTKIIPLRDEMRIVDGMQIIGIDYPDQMESKDIGTVIKNMPEFDSKKPSILLWHAPTQIDAAKNAGISLQLSGHTHKGQLFPLGFITALVYKGYDYGLKQAGSYSEYTSSGLGGWGPPMRTEKTSEIVDIILK